jgi:hypothetical protein
MSFDQTLNYTQLKDAHNLTCDMDEYMEIRTRNQMRMHKKRNRKDYHTGGLSPKRFKGRKSRMQELQKICEDKTNGLTEKEKDDLNWEWRRLCSFGVLPGCKCASDGASDNPVEDENIIKWKREQNKTEAMKRIRTVWIMPRALEPTTIVWNHLNVGTHYKVEEEWEKHGDIGEFSWKKFKELEVFKKKIKEGDVRILPDGNFQRLRFHSTTDFAVEKRWERFWEYETPWGKIKWNNKKKWHTIHYKHPNSEEEQVLDEKPYFQYEAEELLCKIRDQLVSQGIIDPWTRCAHEIK